MSKDCTGPLSLETLEHQFCSDWLKEEIRRVFAERDALAKEVDRLKAALIHSEHCMDGMADSNQELVKLENRLRSKLEVAREALEEITGGDLASGEGIYKAEIARTALAQIGDGHEGS